MRRGAGFQGIRAVTSPFASITSGVHLFIRVGRSERQLTVPFVAQHLSLGVDDVTVYMKLPLRD